MELYSTFFDRFISRGLYGDALIIHTICSNISTRSLCMYNHSPFRNPHTSLTCQSRIIVRSIVRNNWVLPNDSYSKANDSTSAPL